MKSNSSSGETVVTKAQFAAVIVENDSPPPTPPIRNSSLRPPLSFVNTTFQNNRELFNLPLGINEKRKSTSSSTSRLSPVSDDGGFNSFNFNINKRNSISVLNENRIFSISNLNDEKNSLLINNHLNSNCKTVSNNYSKNTNKNKFNSVLNANLTNSNHSFQTSSSLTSLSAYEKWNNLSTFDKNFVENNQNSSYDMNIRHNYFSDLEADYQNITYNSSNNFLSSQNCKSDNWSSTTSVLSTYTGITSTSDYYTASSEAMTNSPSLSSLNSPSLSSTVCNSPPLSSNTTSMKMYSGVSTNKNSSYNKHFSCTAPQISSKISKSSFLPINTSIATSSIVEKPKRQESASVLYYLVAKNSNSSNELSKNIENLSSLDETQMQNNSKLNETNCFLDDLSLKKNNCFDKIKCNSNKNINFLNNSADLKAIQKHAVYQFYLRHKNVNASKLNSCEQQTSFDKNDNFDQLNKSNSKNNLTNYSLISNDSVSSSSSTISPSNSERTSPSALSQSTSNYICRSDRDCSGQYHVSQDDAIYTNINSTSLDFNENNKNFNSKDKFLNNTGNVHIKSKIEMIRTSFRNKISFKKNKENSHDLDSAHINGLKNINQLNNVKHIAKQFDNLRNNSNCDLNANKVSPSIFKMNKSKDKISNLNGSSINEKFVSINESLNESDKLNSEAICENNNPSSLTNTESNLLEDDLDKLQSVEEEFKFKIKHNEEKIEKFLDYLKKNEITKVENEKIILHIEEVDKVTKLFISLTCRLNKIENLLQFWDQQKIKNENNLNQLFDTSCSKLNQFKQSNSTDSLLGDGNNMFSSLLSLSSISLNNINCASSLFASVEMLNSKKNKLLDQLEEATQLKQMIERRCINLNEKIICKYFDFAKLKQHQEFSDLMEFNFVSCMNDKFNFLTKCKELEYKIKVMNKQFL